VLALALLPWTLLGGGAGCLGSAPPPPTQLCPGPVAKLVLASGGTNEYVYDYPGTVVDARGIDWAGQSSAGVELQGSFQGCFQGGRITGTWDPAALWETYHLTAALSVQAESSPMRVMSVHARNYGDGVSIEPYVPCPNGSLSPWLSVRSNHLEDIHDDAIESDGLCATEIADNLIERAFVAFGFRNRSSDPNRSGSSNVVVVDGNLVRLHAFANNYDGQPTHGAFWKWAHERRGPRIAVRNNRFLAFDPTGGLFPLVNRVTSCQNNVLLFAGSEAEWAQALAGGCDDHGDDGLCEGERMLALAGCFTVITKPDAQSEAEFLATQWDPYVATWKASHSADDE
jgi:hypothetical protein